MEDGKTYRVREVWSDECPASLITPRSKHLIEIEAMNAAAQKATGATLHGQDAAGWPALWHDLVTLIQTQRGIDEAAFQRSLNDGRR